MPLFNNFNKSALSTPVRPSYRRLTELQVLRFHRVEDITQETTSQGPALRIVLTTDEGQSVYTYVSMDMSEEDTVELRELVRSGQAPFFVTYLQSRRLNLIMLFSMYFYQLCTYCKALYVCNGFR